MRSLVRLGRTRDAGIMPNILIKLGRLLLYSTVITPLIVASDFYFPYIVPKAIFFRIVIELALAIWLYLWWRGKKIDLGTRLKKNYFVLALAVLFATDLIASVFGLSFSNSLFSDIERSWGLYTLLHLYLFYFLLRAFFGKREWRIYLHCLLGSTSAVAVYGIVQYYPAFFGIKLFASGPGRIMSTLGNPAYTAMALIFGLGFAIYLFMDSGQRRARYLYLAAVALEFFALTLTSIRGAYLGLLAGILLAAALLLVLSKNRFLKIGLAVVLVLMFVGGSAAVKFRQNPAVRSLPIIDRLSSISMRDGTVITRLIGWRAALSGFKDNPIFGVGLENFNVVFNKYFNPIYYTYAPSEPYFDRAHNSYLDRLSMTGLLGLAAFLALIGVLIFYLVRGWRFGHYRRGELALFAGVGAAYLVHIFFVFDDLSALLFFLSFLGLIEFRFYRESLIDSPAVLLPPGASQPARAFISVLGLIIIFWFGLVLNGKIAQASKNEIRALMAQASNAADAGRLFQSALSVPYIPRNVLVVPYVDFLVKQANEYAKTQSADAKNLFDGNFTALERILSEERDKNKLNPLFLIKSSTVHSARWILYRDPADANLAVNFIQEAIRLSPSRPQYYNLLAESYVIFGDGEKAVAAAEKSYGMNQNYNETYLYVVRAYAAAGKFDKAIAAYENLLSRGYISGTDEVSTDLVGWLNKAGQFQKARSVGEKWLAASPNNPRALINLTITALKQGKRAEAIALAEKVAAADASYKKDVDYVIGEIKKGNVETLLKQLGQ